MMNLLKTIYAKIFPKENGEGYSTGEMVARIIVWGIVFSILFGSIYIAFIR